MKLSRNIILFDGQGHNDLLPLTFTRPVAELRVGIMQVREKWASFAETVSWHTVDYLATKYPARLGKENLFIYGGLLPNEELIAAISKLSSGEALWAGDDILAYCSAMPEDPAEPKGNAKQYTGPYSMIRHPWDIFSMNDEALRADFTMLTRGRKTVAISATNRISGAENVFIEPGAKVEYALINAMEGPVYIDRDAEVMEGAMIRGPLYLGQHSQIKMGARIYGATTIGPHCKIAGEIHNAVITGYSSKAHDGYLGNAVLGEWCNLGADTNCSNLKNNYEQVKVWSYSEERFLPTGLQFCGLIMGDHSKSGINTMFNTGTVVGVSANIFGSGFPRTIIPSFSWGGPGGMSVYNLKKALETARRVMQRRNLELTEQDISILTHIFEHTEKHRK